MPSEKKEKRKRRVEGKRKESIRLEYKNEDVYRRVLVEKVEKPFIEPRKNLEWECLQTFNAGAAVIEDKVHFLYRAVGSDYVSRFGYANSKDSFHLDERLDEPVYQHKVKHTNYYSYISGEV